MLAPFYYHPRMTKYDFGPQHPLKPDRLRRAITLVERLSDVRSIDPGPGATEQALRMHDEAYVDVVREISAGRDVPLGAVYEAGFASSDNPPFRGIYEASLAYLAGSVEAAEDVRDGAPLAFSLAGGLHHARRSRASGFCVFNDPAIAIHVLKERLEKVAYVDIDVHHGDGVQWLWYDDPTVMTCSIHQDGRTLYPGTGSVEETGAACTSINVPLWPGTVGDVWLWAFREGIKPALEAFEPEAVVLQLGTDAHFMDPLARLNVSAQEWLEAVKDVKALGVPTVAVGGGGYSLQTVPRMWASAVFTLCEIPFEDQLPSDLAEAWDTPTFFDPLPAGPSGQGRAEAEVAIEYLRERVLPSIGRV